MTSQSDDLPVLVIDGVSFSDFDGFAREFSRLLCDYTWRGNLDAFNDLLRGGFGTPEHGWVLRRLNSESSRAALGYEQTTLRLEGLLYLPSVTAFDRPGPDQPRAPLKARPCSTRSSAITASTAQVVTSPKTGFSWESIPSCWAKPAGPARRPRVARCSEDGRNGLGHHQIAGSPSCIGSPRRTSRTNGAARMLASPACQRWTASRPIVSSATGVTFLLDRHGAPSGLLHFAAAPRSQRAGPMIGTGR